MACNCNDLSASLTVIERLVTAQNADIDDLKKRIAKIEKDLASGLTVDVTQAIKTALGL